MMTCVSCQALAYGYINANVTSVRIDQTTGFGMVIFDQNLNGTRPGCSSTIPNALAFNTNTAAGKAVYALVLSAKLSGTPVNAIGLGTCSVYGNYVEDWDYGLL